MTLLADFEDERLLQHIKTSGLLDGFTDFLGNAQPALEQYSGFIDLSVLASDKRAIMVRLSGNDQFATGTIPMSQYPVTISLFGKSGIGNSDAGVMNGLTSDIRDWLRVNYKSDDQCIISIQVLGKGGPFYTDDSRIVFEIPLIVKFTAAVEEYDPLSLFANGEEGAWFVPHDLSTLFQDAAGTTPVTANGDPVGRMLDKSNNGNHALQTVSASRPTYVNEKLQFDRVDDNLSVALPDGDYRVTYNTEHGVIDSKVRVSGGAGWQFYTDPRYTPPSTVGEMVIYPQDEQKGKVKAYLGSDYVSPASMARAFLYRSDLVELDVSNWDTSNVTTFFQALYNCSSLTSLDVSNWDTSNVTNFIDIFNGCSSLTSLDVSNWDTSNVATFLGAFNGCSSLTSLDVSNWDTSSVTRFDRFITSTGIVELDVSNWDTSNVTNFFLAFADCSSLTSLDVSNWNTSNVINFNRVAFGCSSLTTVKVNGGTGNPFADSPCTDYTDAFTGTNLTQQSIDDILVAINAAGTSGGRFKQTGGSAPSATGEAAIDALRSRGWAITVTGGY